MRRAATKICDRFQQHGQFSFGGLAAGSVGRAGGGLVGLAPHLRHESGKAFEFDAQRLTMLRRALLITGARIKAAAHLLDQRVNLAARAG